MRYLMTGAAARALMGAALVSLLAACQSVPLQSHPPQGFDLSGSWQLVPEDSGSPPSQQSLRARGGMLSFVAQDFAVLRAREMHIEQNPGSMGIYYDGRDYRDVSWGTRRRGLWEVQAGWNEGRLVILSKANDADARETLTLAPDGQRLRVDIEVKSKGENLALTRVFRRQQDG
jgi:hypothetical protein